MNAIYRNTFSVYRQGHQVKRDRKLFSVQCTKLVFFTVSWKQRAVLLFYCIGTYSLFIFVIGVYG